MQRTLLVGVFSLCLASTANAEVNLHVNGAGLLTFGLDPTIEVGGSHVSALAFARFLNTGAGPYLITALSGDDSFTFGIGLGGGFRWYKTEGQRGFYLGASAEYLTYRSDDEDDARYLSVKALGLLGGVGYRFVLGDSFILGLGGEAGFTSILSEGSYDVDTNEPKEDDWEEPGRLLAIFRVELGFFL